MNDELIAELREAMKCSREGDELATEYLRQFAASYVSKVQQFALCEHIDLIIDQCLRERRGRAESN